MVSASILDATPDKQSGPGLPGHATSPDATPHSGGPLLDRVKTTARSIEDRVRRALIPTDAEVAPLRVLVVDDHPDSADSLADVLELLGCPARACYNGLSALATADEFQPHVCLLDLMMPGMDGLELAGRLRDRAGGRPLLLVATTALGDWEIRTRTALAGFHYHLTKPVDIPTMIETISRWGEVLGRPVDKPRDDTPAPPAD
jgi:CheY-like chemotaxis protein